MPRKTTKSKRAASRATLPSGALAGRQDVNPAELKLIPSASPAVWVDRMEIGIRGDVPVATLRFYGVCPPFLIEALRLQTSVDHLRLIADVLCQSLNYYPSKPDPKA